MLASSNWLAFGAVAVFLGCALPIACGGRKSTSPGGSGDTAGGGAGTGIATDGFGTGTGISMDGAGIVSMDGGYVHSDGSGPFIHGDGSGPFIPVDCGVNVALPVSDAGDESRVSLGGLGDGAPGTKVLCQSAPRPANQQMVECEKLIGQDLWTCRCTTTCEERTCTTNAEMPCGPSNCCGFPTWLARGCAKQAVTLAPINSCAGSIASGAMMACPHLQHLGLSEYGPFTSCCPPQAPFSCPTGLPTVCYSTAEEARAACSDDCVECTQLGEREAGGPGD